jgi:hypothetical protein
MEITSTQSGRPSSTLIARDTSESGKSNYKLLRICCWFVALALGAADAWATRFTMNPDGVSYLDIGDAYWRGDWHNAINAYWSPLYSWILGCFLKVLKPSMYWEYPLVHLVNFLIYVAALACFEFFLATFIAERKQRDQDLTRDGLVGLSESSWWVLGYSLFISSSLILIGMHYVTPDMCVAAFVYLASALILKINGGTATRKTYIVLGVILGFGYLAKAVMFPLGFVFLMTVLLAGGLGRTSLRNTVLAGLAFLAIASPFMAALSHAKGRVTFGESGKITYEIFIDKTDIFVPTESAVMHPVRNIFDVPRAHEFASPISGTYPLWYDPTYWHEGIKPGFQLAGELKVLKYAFLAYFMLIGSIFLQLNVSVAVLMFLLTAPLVACLKRASATWPLFVPAVVAITCYAFVYTEYRYVAAFVSLLWLSVIAGIHLPASAMTRRFTANLVFGISATTVLIVVWSISNNARQSVPVHWQVASALAERGISLGEGIATIADEPFGDGGAFIARLAKLRIVAQTEDVKQFYEASPSVRAKLCESFRNAGAKLILVKNHPGGEPVNGWQRLGNSEYFVWNSQLPHNGRQ